jgi:FKBP-type peptidyl-prolyl cis-trans isomerase (trigger factor)
MPEAIEPVETSRDGAVREFSLHIPASLIEERVAAQLAKTGQSVRLPGFRPGKIPLDVLRQRYGARARTEAIQRMVSQARFPEGGLIAAVEIAAGEQSGDVHAKITATYLRDLPEIDFANITLERWVLAAPDAASEAAAAAYLKQQALDHLDRTFRFPVPPGLIANEFERMWHSAQEELEPGVDPGALASELRSLAERRVRLGLVLTEVARRHRITVDEDAAPQVRTRLLEEKVMAWMLSRATVTDCLVTPEELAAIAD